MTTTAAATAAAAAAITDPHNATARTKCTTLIRELCILCRPRAGYGTRRRRKPAPPSQGNRRQGRPYEKAGGRVCRGGFYIRPGRPAISAAPPANAVGPRFPQARWSRRCGKGAYTMRPYRETGGGRNHRTPVGSVTRFRAGIKPDPTRRPGESSRPQFESPGRPGKPRPGRASP